MAYKGGVPVNSGFYPRNDFPIVEAKDVYVSDEQRLDAAIEELRQGISNKVDDSHNHDDRYYTGEVIDGKLAEINNKIDDKADSDHNHNDDYYTEEEIDSKLLAINESISNITSGEVVVKKAESATTAESATNAGHATTADSATSAGHATTADNATNATNATNANHATTADSATNATNATNATKATQDASGNVITSTYETKSDASAKLDAAKGYADEKVKNLISSGDVDSKISTHNTSNTAHDDIRQLISNLSEKVSNFLNVDDTTTDELSEILKLISDNRDTLDSLLKNNVGKSDIVDNLTTANKDKVLSANQGVALKALIDALQGAFKEHDEDAVAHITNAERTNWSAAYAHSQAAHAPIDAEKNQNAFSNVKVGDVIVAADTVTDTLTLVAGDNVTIVADANGDTITISATDTIVEVDDALSASSTNPVQNKIVNEAVTGLQTQIDEIQEITDEDIRSLFAVKT